jgi:hypothetical protein
LVGSVCVHFFVGALGHEPGAGDPNQADTFDTVFYAVDQG